jgi:hypothetical protein
MGSFYAGGISLKAKDRSKPFFFQYTFAVP